MIGETKTRSKRNLVWILLCFLLMLTIIPGVYAQDDDTVNLLDLPDQLAKALGIPVYAGKLLICSIFMMMLFLPTVIFARKMSDKAMEILMATEGIVMLGLFIAIGWLEVWYMLIVGLIVAVLWAGKMKGMIG